MKEYHEVACIKDGNKVEGFLIASDSYRLNDKLEYSHVDYVSLEDMKRMAKNGLIQYFVYNEKLDRLEIEYTEEEIRQIKSLGTTDTFIAMTSTLQDYLKNDIIIKKQHYDLMLTNQCLCGSLMTVQKLPLLSEIIVVTAFGNMNYLNNQISKMPSSQKRLFTQSKIYDNIANLYLPARYYLEATRGLNLLVDLSILNQDNMVEGMKGAVKRAILNKVVVRGEHLKDITKVISLKNKEVLTSFNVSY